MTNIEACTVVQNFIEENKFKLRNGRFSRQRFETTSHIIFAAEDLLEELKNNPFEDPFDIIKDSANIWTEFARISKDTPQSEAFMECRQTVCHLWERMYDEEFKL